MPTAAEREVERLKFRVVEVENAIRVIGQQVSRTRTQFNIQDEPNDVEKQENKND